MRSVNAKNRILMIHHGSGIGGAPRSMSYFARALSECRKEVCLQILCMQKSSACDLFDKMAITINTLPYFYIFHMSKWVRFWEVHKLLAQFFSFVFYLFFYCPFYLYRVKPSVVYLNSSVLLEWVLVARLFRIPTIVHVRERISYGHLGVRRWLIGKILGLSEAVIFISNDNLMALYSEKRSNHHVVYNYSPSKLAAAKDTIKRYDFIYLGGSSSIKGWSLVRRLIVESSPKIRFCLLGTYSDEDQIFLAGQSSVTFIGESIYPEFFLSESRYLISPFVTPHFSRPIIEAYSVGTVPIASRLDGIQEQIIEGDTGFLFNVSSFDDFFRCVRMAVDLDSGDYHRMLENGSRYFDDHFSIKNEQKLMNLVVSFLDI